jgi:hypothetical protein
LDRRAMFNERATEIVTASGNSKMVDLLTAENCACR